MCHMHAVMYLLSTQLIYTATKCHVTRGEDLYEQYAYWSVHAWYDTANTLLRWESLYDSRCSKQALLGHETTKCFDGIQKHFYNEARCTLFNWNSFIPCWSPWFQVICLHAQLRFSIDIKMINAISKTNNIYKMH